MIRMMESLSSTMAKSINQIFTSWKIRPDLKPKLNMKNSWIRTSKKFFPDQQFHPAKQILELLKSKYFFTFPWFFSCKYYNGTSGRCDWTPEPNKNVFFFEYFDLEKRMSFFNFILFIIFFHFVYQ